jgi:protein-tyrosine phosphatase
MWRSGAALRPYFEDVKLVVQLKASIPELHGYDIVDESKLSFVHFPIKDCGITDVGRVLELAKLLVKSISENEIIYLHCWGGHGRTGTLVCIMLHLMYGVSA